MRVNCLAQEHNAMSLVRGQTCIAQFGEKCTNCEVTIESPPKKVKRLLELCCRIVEGLFVGEDAHGGLN